MRDADRRSLEQLARTGDLVARARLRFQRARDGEWVPLEPMDICRIKPGTCIRDAENLVRLLDFELVSPGNFKLGYVLVECQAHPGSPLWVNLEYHDLTLVECGTVDRGL